MAITQTFSRVSYTGNGSTTQFSFSSKVFALTDISVVVVKDLTTGAETTLTVGVDYTIVAVSGNLDNGVTIDTSAGSTPATYTSNDQLTLIRSIAETQTLELEEGGDMPANELEDALDRCVMISQQNADDGGRHISHPATDPSGLSYEAPTVELRKGKACGWDASTGAVVALSIADEGGAFTAVNTNTGLSASAGTISCEVDDTSIEFDGNGDFSVKDGGITNAMLAGSITTTKLASPTGADTSVVTGTAGANGQLAGWNADGDAVDSGFDVTDNDNLGTSDTTLPTQGNVKAYVDTYAMKYSGATEHSSAMPTAGYTNLDLSSTVGVNRAFVHLSVEPDVDCELMFVPNGVAKDVGYTAGASKAGAGASAATCTAGNIVYLSLITDASGVVDWKSTVAGTTTTVKVLAYQVLQ
jgi:hypothetical protein